MTTVPTPRTARLICFSRSKVEGSAELFGARPPTASTSCPTRTAIAKLLDVTKRRTTEPSHWTWATPSRSSRGYCGAARYFRSGGNHRVRPDGEDPFGIDQSFRVKLADESGLVILVDVSDPELSQPPLSQTFNYIFAETSQGISAANGEFICSLEQSRCFDENGTTLFSW